MPVDGCAPELEPDTELIVCETCGSAEQETHGRTRGEHLIAQLTEAMQHTPPARPIALSSTRCLWSCSRSCAVHLRSPGRVGYVIGSLEPNAEHARALLDYAALYAATPDGAVPLKQRPAALRGHFVCRIPPPSSALDGSTDAIKRRL